MKDYKTALLYWENEKYRYCREKCYVFWWRDLGCEETLHFNCFWMRPGMSVVLRRKWTKVLSREMLCLSCQFQDPQCLKKTLRIWDFASALDLQGFLKPWRSWFSTVSSFVFVIIEVRFPKPDRCSISSISPANSQRYYAQKAVFLIVMMFLSAASNLKDQQLALALQLVRSFI